MGRLGVTQPCVNGKYGQLLIKSSFSILYYLSQMVSLIFNLLIPLKYSFSVSKNAASPSRDGSVSIRVVMVNHDDWELGVPLMTWFSHHPSSMSPRSLGIIPVDIYDGTENTYVLGIVCSVSFFSYPPKIPKSIRLDAVTLGYTPPVAALPPWLLRLRTSPGDRSHVGTSVGQGRRLQNPLKEMKK